LFRFSIVMASPQHEALEPFHPVVKAWFQEEIGDPTEPQIRGWPAIRDGKSVLVAAPTGSGKTLAAFLACLDQLFRRAAAGTLTDETQVLYLSPLKALGNDVQKNLLQPLERLRERAKLAGIELPDIRVQVRTGDTSAADRAMMVKKPPHILITTPESLFLYLTADRSRKTLQSVKTVVVDEIHALARDKRGSHFALSMERLKSVCGEPQLVGLSATQKPLELLAKFLTGTRSKPCEVIHVGHLRPWDLRLETPEDELSAVATHEMWGQIYDRLAALADTNRTMLVFANTRRLSERIAHDLGSRLGEDKVAAHHGSMAREARLKAEERLKAGQLKVMVATASLELGLDIGSIDLVAQIGSPRSIAVMLQRLGRSGHRKSAISKGILFAMTRDELVECTAMVRAIHEGTLDAVRMPDKPLDILAQQVVAEVAAKEWKEDELFALFRAASPFESLTQDEYEKVLTMVSEGVSTRRGRSRVHLHRDRVNGILRARKGARLYALQNGGAIPDTFQYPVIAEPEEKRVGTVDEDWAVESMPGDVFLLGSTSWRIRRIYDGAVRVEDALGQPPSVPFWNGEAPARTDELSVEVSRLREDLVKRDDAQAWLTNELKVPDRAAQFLVQYLRAGSAALGAVPTQHQVVAERFFDDAGGMQLIIHAPFGARINKAWGLALRKSFCRQFDFELQAAATDDAILLSLGEQHSFPLIEILDFVHPNSAEKVLTQAVLQAPLFGTRFRWTAGRALALSRMNNGKRLPPPIQRARAEDLIAAVFPEQVGCQDNHGNMEIEPPDHPIVTETMKDCLKQTMDIDGLKAVLEEMRAGRITKRAVDLPEPSVFAHGMLNSAPYTYLDDAPLEERRARAVSVRRTLPEADAAAFGTLDADAIAQVIDEAQPEVRDAEELHDLLLQLYIAPVETFDDERERWLEELRAGKRAGVVEHQGRRFAYPAERVPQAQSLFPQAVLELQPLPGDLPVPIEEAQRQAVRGYMEIAGPVTTQQVVKRLLIDRGDVEITLTRLEGTGQVLRGIFNPVPSGAEGPHTSEPLPTEWCDRRLLQRIHRLTVGRLRKEIEPLSAQDLMRFLFRWHYLDGDTALRGTTGLSKVLTLLEGYEAPAAAWEQELFPSRMRQYVGEWLEQLSWNGEAAWGRLTLRDSKPVLGPRRGVVAPVDPPEPVRRAATPTRNASLSFVTRPNLEWLLEAARPGERLSDGPAPFPEDLSVTAKSVAQALERRGASFFAELVSATRRLPAEVEDALWELLAHGLVTADAVQNLRVLQSPKLRRRQRAMQRGGPGRWSLLRPLEQSDSEELLEKTAKLFLRRYGIVFRDLVMRESIAPPWRELLQVYRRMEARGEIRGGRFLSGFAGEQYALPDAVEMARQTRRREKDGKVVRISATDPLNLTGVVTPGARVPAIMGHYVTYVDGVPKAQPSPLAGEGGRRDATAG
jgi:ATP-dependent Lhr-like helicase